MQITSPALAAVIDHTSLRPEATTQDIVTLCREAVDFGFKAVCINPGYVNLAYQELRRTPVAICTVIGFPLGAGTPAVKAAEAAEAVKAGAMEVDMVMNIGLFKSKLFSQVQEDIRGVVRAAKAENTAALVKVILETCLLDEAEKVTACLLAVEAGADFIKTSTGFNKEGAQLTDIKQIRKTVGPRIGIKAAGGIRDRKKALDMLEAGADRIGTSAGVALMRESM